MNQILRSRRRRLVVGVGLLLLLGLVAGCEPRTAKVSGRVLYKDQPVPGGWVMFGSSEPGTSASQATIDDQGHYEITARVGEVQILVDNQELAPMEKSAAPKLPEGLNPPPGGKGDAVRPAGGPKTNARYVEIPPRYYKFETSGLTYTVKPGPQTYDIELK
jgi:hypothetical protein